MSVIDTLVVDRTEADVKTRSDIGHYNSEDLNRVGTAINYVAERLRGAGYSVPVSPKTDWSMADVPTEAQLDRYLDNVSALRAVLPVLPTTPEVPPDMEGLTWQEANDIEKILVDIDHLITNMTAAWFYSGELYAGEA